jgi:hypothetical protein
MRLEYTASRKFILANCYNPQVSVNILADQDFFDGTSPRIYPWN